MAGTRYCRLKKTGDVTESFKLLTGVEKGVEVAGNCGYNLRRCFEGFIIIMKET